MTRGEREALRPQIHGRDEHGFTPGMAARMRAALVLAEHDERPEQPPWSDTRRGEDARPR